MFVCVHNAGKSQMAAAIMRQLARGLVEVRSAGTEPDAQVHDLSAIVVAELGADMSNKVPTRLAPSMLTAADRVVVLGTEARVLGDPRSGCAGNRRPDPGPNDA